MTQLTKLIENEYNLQNSLNPNVFERFENIVIITDTITNFIKILLTMVKTSKMTYWGKEDCEKELNDSLWNVFLNDLNYVIICNPNRNRCIFINYKLSSNKIKYFLSKCHKIPITINNTQHIGLVYVI